MGLIVGLLDLLYPPRCPFCGALLPREDRTCPQCADAPFWIRPEQAVTEGRYCSRVVCAGWYQKSLRQSMLRFKFNGRREYARSCGPVLARRIRQFLPGAYDVISWMPVSAVTLKDRGYDQARLLAEAVAESLGTKAEPLLEKTGRNVPQSSLTDRRKRRANVAGVYAVLNPEAVRGRRVLLIDDILTTGATLEEGARVLRAAGAVQVVAAAFCRTPRTGSKEEK